MSKIEGLAGALAICVLGFLVIWDFGSGGSPLAGAAPADGAPERSAPSTRAEETASDAMNRSPVKGGLVANLLVVDPSGAPLQGVEVRSWDPRPTLAELPVVIAETDEVGVVAIEVAEIARVVLSLDGYQSAVLGLLPNSSDRVVMQPAYRLEVFCRDPMGNPLEGIAVSAGRAPGQPGLFSGLDPRTAVASGATDAHGRATLTGLVPSRYSVGVATPEGWTVYRTNIPDSFYSHVEVPCPPVEFVLGELYGVVLQPADDHVAFWKTRSVQGAQVGNSLSGSGWFDAQERLREEFPGALALVRAPRWEPGQELTPPSMTVLPFLRHRGWVDEVGLLLLPLSQVRPRPLELAPRDPDALASGEVVLQLRGRGGAVIPGARRDRVIVRQGAERTGEILLAGRLGDRMCLPIGEVTFELKSDWYTAFCREPLAVSVTEVSQVVEWQLDGALYPTRWEFRVEGRPVPSDEVVAVRARHRVRGIDSTALFSGADSPVYLCAGEWEVEAIRAACESVKQTVIVQEGTGADIIVDFHVAEILR